MTTGHSPPLTTRPQYKLTHDVDTAPARTKEELSLGELRARLNDLENVPDDKGLIKWLQARNFDVSKAETMYRNSMAYREKMKVESLAQDFTPPEVLTKYYPGGFLGLDKEGRPIRVELHGKLDLKGVVFSARQIDIEKFKLILWEKLANMCRDNDVDGSIVIADMEGMSTKMLWKPGVQMYQRLLKILEDNYPEMMKKMFIINAPRVFILLYRLVRPLLTDATKQKMHVLGSDYPKTLLKHIDADVLPACYGGKRTDSDGNPRCVKVISPGGTIPEEYYLKEMINTDTMTTATVARGDKLQLDFHVTKPGSVLRWEFMTEGFDIGFGVFRQEKDVRVIILETDRVKSHLIPEDGSLTCQYVGTYCLVFDNSFSWARGKSIHYNIEVMEPTDAEETTQDISNMIKDGLTLDDVIHKDD